MCTAALQKVAEWYLSCDLEVRVCSMLTAWGRVCVRVNARGSIRTEGVCLAEGTHRFEVEVVIPQSQELRVGARVMNRTM